jgi:hypothetical protein
MITAAVVAFSDVAAQPSPGATSQVPRSAPVNPARVAGRIFRVTAAGERPVPRQWVILHGIGSTGGRAIDSTRTVADGTFRLSYDRGTDSTAQYFVSTVHHGIAYVSGVLPPEATVDDATLTVFDTTSAPVRLAVRGRHILVFAPTDTPRRRVAEIYELSNDTTVTRVASSDGSPLWTAGVPAAAEEFSSGPEMLSNEAIRLDRGRVVAYAPVAPGLKRIAFTYALPAAAFPVSFPVDHPTEVFEILIEDREAEVTGPQIEETAPTNIEGHVFRRFQAQAMAAPAVVTVRVPAAAAAPMETNALLAAAVGIVMIGALVVALRRGRGHRPVAVLPPIPLAETETDALAREIAALDAAFESGADRDEHARARYQAERDRLKRRLAEQLAARGRA